MKKLLKKQRKLERQLAKVRLQIRRKLQPPININLLQRRYDEIMREGMPPDFMSPIIPYADFCAMVERRNEDFPEVFEDDI